MTRPQPVYSVDAQRVEQLLNRLRSMFSSNSGEDNYNRGIRHGIRTASLAVKEDLDANIRQTLCGPPPPKPSVLELLANIDPDDVLKLAEEAEYHDVGLANVIAAAGCEHEFEVQGTTPDGGDWFTNCASCGVSREFVEAVGWPLGEIACQFCAYDTERCAECGRGYGG